MLITNVAQCRAIYKTGSGTTSQKLYETLVGIQTGHIEDTKGWVVQVN